MPDSWLKWIFTGLALLTVLIFTQPHVGSPNDAARMATIQALAEQHTFSLDSVILKSEVDIMRRNGHNMSDKPPMLQFLAAVTYYPFYLVGLDFAHHYGFIYYFLTFIFSGLPYLGLVWLTGLILEKLGWHWSGKIVTFFLMGWGTIILPFAITFNNHLFTAFLILWGVYWYGFHLIGDHSKPLQWVLLGGILSVAFTLEFPTGGLAMLFFLVLIGIQYRAKIGYFLAGLILPLGIHFILNYYQTGDLIPAYLHLGYYQFDGSFWGGALGKKRMFGKTIPGQYFHMLIGYRGIFLFAPVLLFGLWETIRSSFSETGWIQKISWLALLIFMGTITSYAIQISDFGGGSYGLRWVIAVLPLFILLSGYWMQRNPAWGGRLVFGLLLIISIMISMIGLYNPWPQNAVNPSPILENIVYMSFDPAAGNTQLANWVVETFSLDKGLSYYELAREAWSQNQTDSAVDYFKISIQKNPAHTLSYYQLGMLLDISHRSSEAIPVFQKLIELEPDNLGVRNNYGLALIHTGNFTEAEKVYRFVLSQDSTNFYTMLGLVNCLRLEAKYQDSLNLAKQTLRLYPESMEAKSIYNQIAESLSKKE